MAFYYVGECYAFDMSRQSAPSKLRSSARVISPMEQYLLEIAQTPLLSVEEERRLSLLAFQGDENARRQLVEANLRLVVSIARSYVGKGMELLDLIEEGNIGLMEGVRRFDPSYNVRLNTYASYWVKLSIRRALVDKAPIVRIPQYLVEIRRKWRFTTQQLFQHLGREPSEKEVQTELQIDAKKMKLLRLALRQQKYDCIRDEHDMGENLLNEFDDGTPDASDIAESGEDLQVLQSALPGLDEREREVLQARFGLDGGAVQTLKEVGSRLGITRERVRQVQEDALETLRSMLLEGEEEEERPEVPEKQVLPVEIALSNIPDVSAHILQLRGGLFAQQHVLSPKRCANILRLNGSDVVRHEEILAREALHSLLNGKVRPHTHAPVSSLPIVEAIARLRARNELLPSVLQLRGGLWHGQIVVPLPKTAEALSSTQCSLSAGDILELQRIGIGVLRTA